MTASAAMIGAGTTFEVETAAGSGTYTALSEITDITPPSSSVDIVDVTHMESPNLTREFISGWNDPGEVSLDMNFVPGSTTDDFIIAWRLGGERRSARITFPNLVVWTFDAFVTGYTPAIPNEDKLTATLTCKVTSSTVVS